MFHLAVLGKVVFGVTADHGEFPNFEFELSTFKNHYAVLLEDVEKRLAGIIPVLGSKLRTMCRQQQHLATRLWQPTSSNPMVIGSNI